MVLLALPPADHLLIERDRGQFVPSRRRRMMANVRAERLLKIPAEPSPELLIPGAAAQTRVVSMAGIRLGSGESARAFKGIICDDIWSSSPACPARQSPSLWGIPSLQKYMRHPRGLARRHGVSDIQFSEFRPQTRAFPCDSPFELARDRFEGRADGTHAWPAFTARVGARFELLGM